MDRHSHRLQTPTSRDRRSPPLPITNDSNNDHITNDSDKDDDDDDDDDDSERFSGFDLERVMDRFGDNVELLELILSSKLEEDRRRTEEAKLKSKQLDYLLQIKREDQQQQSQQSSSASASTLTQVYSPQPNRETYSKTDNNDLTPFGPSFSSPSSAYETSYPPNHRSHYQERKYTPEASSDSKKVQQPERSIQTQLAPGNSKPIVSLSTPLPSIDSLDRMAHTSSSFFPSSSRRPPPPPPPPFTYTNPETLPPFLHHQHERSNSSPSTQSHEFISPPPPQKLPLPLQGTASPNAPPPFKRRRREMQSITMIIETKEYPYNDSYHWKNNGNTVHKKSGQRSIYYKCANKGCHVNKTVTFKGHGEYLIKYRGKHLDDCASSSSL